MMNIRLLIAAMLATAVAAGPTLAATPLPDPVRKMIDAAIDTGDEKAVAAVVEAARRTNPDSFVEIDEMTTAHQQQIARANEIIAAERRQRLAQAAFYQNWAGEIELGASRFTGNNDGLALYASVKLNRKGIKWTHEVNTRVDRQESDGVTTADRLFASYLPRYNFNSRFYSYGIGQYERDRFLGYANRLTTGVGAGYAVIQEPNARLQIEGGPVLRYTRYVQDFVLDGVVDRERETRLAARGSIGLRWNVSPTLLLTHDTSLFVEQSNVTAAINTALDTKVIGRLKARLSYNIQYERDAPDGRDPLDTISRATLVYSF